MPTASNHTAAIHPINVRHVLWLREKMQHTKSHKKTPLGNCRINSSNQSAINNSKARFAFEL
jgi:hypothetical protein